MMGRPMRRFWILASLVVLLIALPATASAKSVTDYFGGGYSVNPTTVVVSGLYNGDPSPATYHFEYIPYTYNENRRCDAQDWSAATKTPDGHVTSLDEKDITEQVSGL